MSIFTSPLQFTRLLVCLLILPQVAPTLAAEPVDFKTLRGFASFADSTYLSKQQVEQSDWAKHSGYKLVRYDTIPQIEIAYLLAENTDTGSQIIAVRGTSNAPNAYVDIDIKLKPDEKTGVPIHSGFAQAAAAIYQALEGDLKKDFVIDTTGHSLGGAVAQVLAMYLDVDGYKVGQVITFGQPKVTNITGTMRFQHLDIIRVVTPDDMVPLVPPVDPMDVNNLDIYWHSGVEVILYEDQRYSLLRGLNSILRAVKFTQKTPSEQNLQHHQMNTYIRLLDNKLDTAKQVPYENSLNLFNLFGSGQ